ncbi:hypothetical protein M0802_000381 [Mischocyttarus mexicanus]|nr:hypothetical protein M0802_000381 [Mischocyttarus mexicanus]
MTPEGHGESSSHSGSTEVASSQTACKRWEGVSWSTDGRRVRKETGSDSGYRMSSRQASRTSPVEVPVVVPIEPHWIATSNTIFFFLLD